MKQPIIRKTINFTDCGYFTIDRAGEKTAHTRRFYKKISRDAVIRELKKEHGETLVKLSVNVGYSKTNYAIPAAIFTQVATLAKSNEPLKANSLSE